MSLAVSRRNQWGSPSCMCLCSAQTSVNVLTIKDRERGRRRERGRLQDWSSLSDERCRLCLMIGKKNSALCDRLRPSPLLLVPQSNSYSVLIVGPKLFPASDGASPYQKASPRPFISPSSLRNFGGEPFEERFVDRFRRDLPNKIRVGDLLADHLLDRATIT